MIALDLFAGTGWGVACQRLGIDEYGVEIMPEAIATREANGMHTAYHDVWDGLLGMPKAEWNNLVFDMHIASPPCQTFSAAGSGTGRKALLEVLGLIDSQAYRNPKILHHFGNLHDPRTALVLTPLAHVYRDLPRLVVWEQVPPVLPVWERAAEEMREWGYSVVTGILNAEQYGVPQTRKRAILIARWDGEARMPTPTHSRYYPRDPSRLDPDVLPWVSMAEALGWNSETGAEDGYVYAGDESDSLVTMLRRDERRGTALVRVEESTTMPAGVEVTVPLAKIKPRSEWLYAGAGRTAVDTAGQRQRPMGEPAHTMTGKGTATRVMRSNYNTRAGKRAGERGERDEAQPAPTVTSKVDRNMVVLVNGTGKNAAQRDAEAPAPTVHYGERPNKVEWQTRPATTVAGDPRIAAPGHHERQMNNATRVTIDEAAALQSYPPGFTFSGTKTKQFLQVGNAVPPRLAEAILSTLLD